MAISKIPDPAGCDVVQPEHALDLSHGQVQALTRNQLVQLHLQ